MQLPEPINGTVIESVLPEFGLEKCYNGTYKCISQTETLDDWLGPWISFLWLMFLLASAFSIRILYKTYIKFRDTLAYKKDDGDYEFRDDISYETSSALCWNLEGKPVEKRLKIMYRIYAIPLLIAWSDLFLDIGYVSSFTTNATRMVSPFIHVRPGIFGIMGVFDIVGTFRIYLCGVMLWKFAEKLDTPDKKKLAQLEVHMEMVVCAFAFILEDFAELFIEYFCVEKYITGYQYEIEYAQSYMAAFSSIIINLICLLSFFAFISNFRKQQQYNGLRMNTLSIVVPLFELVLSSLRTYRFLIQAFLWRKYRPNCLSLVAVDTDEETGEFLYKAYQSTFTTDCFRLLDWLMVVLMCIYVIILIAFVVVYIVKIRPQYNLALSDMQPDNLLGDYKKIPKEMNKFIVKPVADTGKKYIVNPVVKTGQYIMPGSQKDSDENLQEKSNDKSNKSSKRKFKTKEKGSKKEKLELVEETKIDENTELDNNNKIPEFI